MSLSEIIVKNQRTFSGALNVNYFLWPAKSDSEHLIVTFSGFNGKESRGEPAYYNYVRPLTEVDCHRLFILDTYEGHPCYYLGKNKKLDYEVTVLSIIHYVANQLNVPSTNIITCGSSKGGTAAVYFGMKYNFGHIIAGGMQIRVGNYLYNLGSYTRDTVLKLITGGNDTDARDYLNDYFEDVFKNSKNDTNINIHVGRGDRHYEDHVLPYINILDARKQKYNLDIKEYSGHMDLGTHFPPFLLENVNRILNDKVVKKKRWFSFLQTEQ